MDFARALWLRVETIHAVTYFGAETTDAATRLGLPGFWFSYFGFRAAPLGRVEGGVVEATFFNFAPSFVRRWVPQIWDLAEPETLIETRRVAAVETLRRICPDVARVAEIVEPVLRDAVERGIAAGRPLFASNKQLMLPGDPVERLWQLCTTLREHRGDGHVAALTSAGLDGLEAHVLIAAEQGTPVDDLQRTRGWTADDWHDAVVRCTRRALLTGPGALSDRGRELRNAIEMRTNELAAAPFDTLDKSKRAGLIETLDPLARAIAVSGTIRYPNPMGLPMIPARRTRSLRSDAVRH